MMSVIIKPYQKRPNKKHVNSDYWVQMFYFLFLDSISHDPFLQPLFEMTQGSLSYLINLFIYSHCAVENMFGFTINLFFFQEQLSEINETMKNAQPYHDGYSEKCEACFGFRCLLLSIETTDNKPHGYLDRHTDAHVYAQCAPAVRPSIDPTTQPLSQPANQPQ